MNIGNKFGWFNMIAAILTMSSSLMLVLSSGSTLTMVLVIILWVSSIVIGIAQLAIVTKEKTKHRGLHISNGVLCILGIWIAVFIIAIVIISKESKETYAMNDKEYRDDTEY